MCHASGLVTPRLIRRAAAHGQALKAFRFDVTVLVVAPGSASLGERAAEPLAESTAEVRRTFESMALGEAAQAQVLLRGQGWIERAWAETAGK